MADKEGFQADYFSQIRKEAQRLADAGLFRQASVLLSMLHNQWIPETGVFSDAAGNTTTFPAGFGADESSGDIWNYRLASLKEQLYEQDLKILFSIAGELIENDKREAAAELLNIFTSLLRLGLRSSAFETSPADTEMELMEQYIQLSNQVSDGRFNISLNVSERSDWSLFQIPSMSMVPVVKHLLKSLMKFDKSGIDVSMNVSDNQQLFMIALTILNDHLQGEDLNRMAAKLRALPWSRYLWKAWQDCYPEHLQEDAMFDVNPAKKQLLFYLPIVE